MHTKLCDVLKKGLPILQWIPNYDIESAIADAIAGITVGLTLIPQAIAYATLAGLDPQYGLYSSLCGGVVYAILGTIPELDIAPTALMALITFTYTYAAPFGAAPAAVLLCFLSGLVEVSCGLLHLGFLVDFVSAPVAAGLASAGALLVATAQIKDLLGLKFQAIKFIDIWLHVFRYIADTKIWDALLSVVCCSLLLGLRHLRNYGTPPMAQKGSRKEKQRHRTLKKVVWFICTGRHALIVIICSILAYVLEVSGKKPLSLTSPVPSGLPTISLPPFEVLANNHTFTFVEMTRELGFGILITSFIGILANIAIAKAFANGKVLQASQEMLAVGMCNVIGSLFSSIPINGSFSRTAVGSASGVRTTLKGIHTSLVVLLSLTFLTPYFSYIPKAALSSVIICAVIFMVEVNLSKTIWRMSKIDFFPLIITFLACLLLGIEIGILIGIAIDIILLLYYTARPKIDVQQVMIGGSAYTRITPTSSIYYPSVEYIREKIMTSTVVHPKSKTVIVDCSKITKADFTAVKCIGALAEDLGKKGYTLAFLRIDPALSKLFAKVCHNCIIAFTDDALATILRERKNTDILNGYKNICLTNETASIIMENGQPTNL